MAKNRRVKRSGSYYSPGIGEMPAKRTVKTKIKITGQTNREAVKETMQKAKSSIAQEILA